MCWNAEVCLNTFIFGMVCCIIVWQMNIIEKLRILIVMSITSMQLLEYFVWKNIGNEKVIFYLSIIGLLIICSQISLLILDVDNIKIRKILYICFILFLVIYFLTDFRKENLTMYKGKNGHLVWSWLDIPLIWIIIGLCFYFIPLYIKNGVISILFITGIVLLIPSLYYYYKYKTWGTLWCYYSNILWFYLLICSIYFYLKRKQNNDIK